jgi:hypothetical protein
MHNEVLNHLRDFCSQLHRTTQASPKGYHDVDEHGSQVGNKQPDLLITLPTKSVLVDVRGVDPCSPSASLRNSKDAHKASAAAAAEKIKKYQPIASRKGVLFQPFVFTIFGALHSSASDLIDMLLANSGLPNKSSIRYTKLAEMTMAIMRDNTRMVQDAHRRA